jgi:hypothetical protein
MGGQKPMLCFIFQIHKIIKHYGMNKEIGKEIGEGWKMVPGLLQ